MIDAYKAYAPYRDKFEMLAFHDATSKTLAELDPKLADPKAKYWRGRDLPFPILMDATGETIKRYGISEFPTTILIDPNGVVVGRRDIGDLLKQLPPLKAEQAANLALDRTFAYSAGPQALAASLKTISESGHVPMTIDEAAIKAAGVDLSTVVPLNLLAGISNRSWLWLLLEPYTLAPNVTNKGVVIGPGKAPSRPTEGERFAERRLRQVMKKPVTIEFRGPLEKLPWRLVKETDESIALDPSGILKKRIDSSREIVLSVKGEPLDKALECALAPLGLTWTVRHEVILIVAKQDSTNGQSRAGDSLVCRRDHNRATADDHSAITPSPCSDDCALEGEGAGRRSRFAGRVEVLQTSVECWVLRGYGLEAHATCSLPPCSHARALSAGQEGVPRWSAVVLYPEAVKASSKGLRPGRYPGDYDFFGSTPKGLCRLATTLSGLES
jgi:hypothetical protein